MNRYHRLNDRQSTTPRLAKAALIGLAVAIFALSPASAQTRRTSASPAAVPTRAIATPRALVQPTTDLRPGARQELQAPVWRQVAQIQDPAVRAAAQRLHQTIQRASSVDPRATTQVRSLFRDYDQAINDLAQAGQQSLEYKTKTFQCLADHKQCKKENGAFKGCGAALLACLVLG